MPDTLQKPRNNNPNAPGVPPRIYLNEKANFAGIASCAIFYGIVVVLFFRCLGALISPANPTTGGTKWLLVAHTVVMFFFVTVFTATNLDILSISYIDNRDFPGIKELPPGALGYQHLTFSHTAGVVSTFTFLLNNWLADGLLLYRCYVIYAMNYWPIVLPSLMYLATFATGILLVYYQISHPTCTIWRSSTINIGIPYSISVSLNVLITLMIITRLVLISREIRSAMNPPVRPNKLYKAVITILSESSALYAITFLLFIGMWAVDNPAEYSFFPILAQVQVIAPFLIVLRVANRRAVSSEIVSGDIGSIHIARRESIGDSGVPSDRYTVGSIGTDTKAPGELGVEVVTTVDFHRDDP